jgi:hypothetical protein
MNWKVLALGAIALASPSFAQVGTGGTITDGNASFQLSDYLDGPTDFGPGSSFHVGGVDNPDHMYQTWWWFRGESEGVQRELALSNGSNALWSGNVGRIDYAIPGVGTARALYVVQGLEDGYGSLTMSLIVRNTTSQSVNLNIFNYLDADLADTSGGDSADLLGSNVVRIIDGDWVATYEGTDIFEVGGYPSILGMLTDDDADDFSGVNGVFPEGDVTAGFQWNTALAPNRAVTFTASFTVTQVPAPGAAALFGAGLGLVGVRRRR